MTLKELIARVMRGMPTIQPAKVSEPDIIDIINEGIKEIAKLSNITTVEEYTVEAETEYVELPDNFLKLKNVFWGEDKRELLMGHSDMPREILRTPKYFYLRKGKIYFRPIPNIEEPMYLVYIPLPAKLVNDGDEPEIENIEEYLVAYTLEKIHLENNSAMKDRWEIEKLKALSIYLDTDDSQYVTPFRPTMLW